MITPLLAWLPGPLAFADPVLWARTPEPLRGSAAHTATPTAATAASAVATVAIRLASSHVTQVNAAPSPATTTHVMKITIRDAAISPSWRTGGSTRRNTDQLIMRSKPTICASLVEAFRSAATRALGVPCRVERRSR
jgi:hypothetical protein